MQMIYPRQFAVIKVPVDLDGSPGATVFQVAHRDPETTIYWNLDAAYIGSTQTFHQMELRPAPGPHRIVLVDEYGNRLEQSFEVALK